MKDVICNHILCATKKPEEEYKLFFGDTGHFLRVDKVEYLIFKNLYEKAFADFWTVTAIDFSKDREGWSKLDDRAQRIFLLNNGYQTLMDSGVVNLYNELIKITSNTELAILYQYIAQNESIHAMSYSYGLAQMFGAEAEEKIDVVYTDPVIQKRLLHEVDYSDELLQHVAQGEVTDDMKKALLKTIVATYILEHIKFPFSFFTTWRLNVGYDNGIQGFSMLLKMIAWDELTTHAPTNGNVLKVLRKETRQGFKHLFDWADKFMYEYARKVAEEEIEWNKYLFKDGNVNSFTEQMGEHFIKYYTDKALKNVGLEPIFNEKKSDIIEWYDSYRDINKQNTALQEVSNNSYKKGNLLNDLNRLFD